MTRMLVLKRMAGAFLWAWRLWKGEQPSRPHPKGRRNGKED